MKKSKKIVRNLEEKIVAFNPKLTEGYDKATVRVISSESSEETIQPLGKLLYANVELNQKDYSTFTKLFYPTLHIFADFSLEKEQLNILAVGAEEAIRNAYQFLFKHKISGILHTTKEQGIVINTEGEMRMAEKYYVYSGEIEDSPESKEILERIKAISITFTVVKKTVHLVDSRGVVDEKETTILSYIFHISSENFPKLEKIIDYFNSKDDVAKEAFEEMINDISQVL